MEGSVVWWVVAGTMRAVPRTAAGWRALSGPKVKPGGRGQAQLGPERSICSGWRLLPSEASAIWRLMPFGAWWRAR